MTKLEALMAVRDAAERNYIAVADAAWFLYKEANNNVSLELEESNKRNAK